MSLIESALFNARDTMSVPSINIEEFQMPENGATSCLYNKWTRGTCLPNYKIIVFCILVSDKISPRIRGLFWAITLLQLPVGGVVAPRKEFMQDEW